MATFLPAKTAIRIAIRIYRAGIEEFIVKVSDKVGDDVAAIKDAFPNPFKMADRTLRALTGWAGLALTIPELGVMRLVRQSVSSLKLDHRVIRADKALLWPLEASRTLTTILTGTNDSGLIETILRSFLVSLYNLIKRIKLLRSFLGSNSVQTFTSKLINSIVEKVGLLKRIAFYLLGVAVITKFSFFVVSLAVILTTEEFSKILLPNDSKRKWIPHTGQHRVRG